MSLNLKQFVVDHCLGFLIIVFLLFLVMASQAGCAIKPEDISSWTNQTRAEVLMLDGKMQRAINDGNKRISTKLLGLSKSVEKSLGEVNGKIDVMQSGITLASKSTNDLIENTLYTGIGSLMGAGGLFGAGKFKRKNGSE